MPQSQSQAATIKPPHALRFSLRSVVVVMAVVAVFSAAFAPAIRERPQLFAIAALGFALGYGIGEAIHQRRRTRALIQAGECWLEVPVVGISRQTIRITTGNLNIFLAAFLPWLVICAPGFIFQMTHVELPTSYYPIAATVSLAIGYLLRFVVRSGVRLHSKSLLRVCKRGVIASREPTRRFRWRNISIVFLRSGNVRLRLDDNPSTRIIAEVPGSRREQLRTFLDELSIPYHSDEAQQVNVR